MKRACLEPSGPPPNSSEMCVRRRGVFVRRLGQYRPIKVIRIVVENSIESRILQLQEKKNLLFQSTVGMDSNALSRLTEEDLRFLFIL